MPAKTWTFTKNDPDGKPIELTVDSARKAVELRWSGWVEKHPTGSTAAAPDAGRATTRAPEK